jgi:hypothetical protein
MTQKKMNYSAERACLLVDRKLPGPRDVSGVQLIGVVMGVIYKADKQHPAAQGVRKLGYTERVRANW